MLIKKMDWKKLSYLKPAQIKKLQNKKLRAFIRTQIPYHPYYSKLFKKNKIKTTDDLVKIPLSSKKDIAPTKQEPKKPLQFILQPNKQLIMQYYPKYKLPFASKSRLEYEYKPVQIHFTTGRTALPTPFFYSCSYGMSWTEAALIFYPYFLSLIASTLLWRNCNRLLF